MEMEFITLKMVLNITANGKMVRQTEKVFFISIITLLDMMGNGKTAGEKEKESCTKITDLNTKVNG